MGLIGAIILIISPVKTLPSEHSWEIESRDTIVTGLVRPTPENFVVRGVCREQGPDSASLAGDNWAVEWAHQSLKLTGPVEGEPEFVEVLPSPCTFLVEYKLSTLEANIWAFDPATSNEYLKSTVVFSEPLTISKVVVSQGADRVFEQLTLQTFPNKKTFSLIRFLGHLLAAGAVLAFVVLTVRRDRNDPKYSQNSGSDFQKNKGGWAINASLLGGLLMVALLSPSHFDDGWIYHRAANSSFTNLLTDPYLSGGLVVQGIWFDRLVGLLGRFELGFLFAKALLVLSVWAAWLILSTALRRFGLLNSSGQLLVAGSLFGAFSAPFLLTLRQEPVVTLFGAMFFASALQFLSTRRSLFLLFAALSSVAAAATHPVGFIFILPTILLAYLSIRPWQGGKGNFVPTIGAGLASFVFGSAIVFSEADLGTLLGEAREKANLENYVRPEWFRWEQLSLESSLFWWPIVLFALAAMIPLFFWDSLPVSQKWVFIASALTPIGLFLSPSKLVTHLGVFVVPGVILFAIVLSRIGQLNRLTAPQLAAFFGLVGGSSLLALDRSGFRHWAYPWEPISEGFIDALLPGSGIGPLWLALPLLPFLGWVVAKKNANVRVLIGAGLVSLFVLAPVINHLGMLSANALFHSGWSPAKQRILELSGRQTCGVLDDVDVIVGASQSGLPSGSFSFTEVGPFGLPATSLSDPGDSVRVTLGEPAEDLVLWVRSTVRNGGVLIELSNTKDQRRSIQLRELDESLWTLVSIPRPTRWDSIKVWPLPNVRGGTGVLVTTVAEPERATSKSRLAGSTIFSGPMVNTYIPCANEPRVIEGVWEASDYIFRNDWGWPIGAQAIHGDLVEVAHREGVRGSFISLVKVVKPE